MKKMLHRAQDVDVLEWYKHSLFEVDVRKYGTELVLSHDSNCAAFKGSLQTFLTALNYDERKTIAFNIKEDGIMQDIVELMKEFPGLDYFFFDMSVPQLVEAIKNDFPVAFRISEFETITVFDAHWKDFHKMYSGRKLKFWLDCFNGNIHGQFLQLDKLLGNYVGCEVFVVSPELHKFDNLKVEFFDRIKDRGDNVIVCTDDMK
jgi:hypothetical protein